MPNTNNEGKIRATIDARENSIRGKKVQGVKACFTERNCDNARIPPERMFRYGVLWRKRSLGSQSISD